MRLLTHNNHTHTACVIATAAAFLLASSVHGGAQPRTVEARGFVHVNGGFQAASTDFTETITFRSNGEDASATTAHAVDGSFLFDVSGGVFVSENLAVGAAVSRSSKDSDAAVSARLPHPFFFNNDRLVDGTQPASRTETAVHIQAQWFVPINDQIEVGVFGGPSFFSVEQGFVRGVAFTDAFPFESATFVSAPTALQSESAVGFNAGADVMVFLTPNMGIGGLVRFSRASVDFAAGDGGTQSLDAGGVQVGGGLRLRF